MAVQLGPNNGLMDRGAAGDYHYDQVMRLYRALDWMLLSRVKSRVQTLPSNPANGDTYIVLAAGPNMNAVARYSSALASWEYFAAQNGWEAKVLDELDGNGQFKSYFFQLSTNTWIERLASGGLTQAQGDARYAPLRKNNISATTDPTVNDDITEGYEPLSRWVNTTSAEVFLCVSNAEGAANWQQATLSLDELGSAALVDVGSAPSNVPTVNITTSLIAGYPTFTPSTIAEPGTKGFVPAPPVSDVRRYLASDGTWQTITIEDVPEPAGTNVGTGSGLLFRDVLESVLRFRTLRSSDSSVEITTEEGTVDLKVVSSGGESGPIAEVQEVGVGYRPAEMAEGNLVLKALAPGNNVSISESAGRLVISASGGGGGGGGAQMPLEAEVSLVVFDRSSNETIYVPEGEAANISLTVSVTLGVDVDWGDRASRLQVNIDPGSPGLYPAGNYTVYGVRIKLTKPDYMKEVVVYPVDYVGDRPGGIDADNLQWRVYSDPQLGVGINLLLSWEAGVVLSTDEEGNCFLSVESYTSYTSALSFDLSLSYLGYGQPLSGVEVPMIDPLSALPPRGLVNILPDGYAEQQDWGTPTGTVLWANQAPYLAQFFREAPAPAPLWASASRAYRDLPQVHRVVRVEIRLDPDYAGRTTVTFLLGSSQRSQWEDEYAALQIVLKESQYGWSEGGRVDLTTLGALKNAGALTGACFVANTDSGAGSPKPSTVVVSDTFPIGTVFRELDYPSLENADIARVFGYFDYMGDGKTRMLYEKVGGGYAQATAVILDPVAETVSDLLVEDTAIPSSSIEFAWVMDYALYACDGVSVFKLGAHAEGVWVNCGRIVDVDEVGLTCVKVAGAYNRIAILSDGRYKVFRGETWVDDQPVLQWGPATSLSGDPETAFLVDAHHIDNSRLAASVRVPHAEWEGVYTHEVWATTNVSYDGGDGQLDMTWSKVIEVDPSDAKLDGIGLGIVEDWAPGETASFPNSGRMYIAAFPRSFDFSYVDGRVIKEGSDDPVVYIPEYPTPPGYKAIVRY